MPACELCHYTFRRSKQFDWKHFRWPPVSLGDKIYHSIFIISILMMLVCATMTVMVFHQEHGLRKKAYFHRAANGNLRVGGKLSSQEVTTLVCGISFFAGFFIAMYAELRAKHSLYSLIKRMKTINSIWVVDEYSVSADYAAARKGAAAARGAGKLAPNKVTSLSSSSIAARSVGPSLPNIPEHQTLLLPPSEAAGNHHPVVAVDVERGN